MVLRCGITFFGAVGILLTKYSSFEAQVVMVLSVLIAFLLSVVVYFIYVRPMRNAESSIAFSQADLAGMVGEVLVPITKGGIGEVLIKVGAGYTNRMAASLDGGTFQKGEKVVVVDIREGVLYVSSMDI